MSTLFTEKQFNTILEDAQYGYADSCVEVLFDNEFFYLNAMLSMQEHKLVKILFCVGDNGVDLSEDQEELLVNKMGDFHDNETDKRIKNIPCRYDLIHEERKLS